MDYRLWLFNIDEIEKFVQIHQHKFYFSKLKLNMKDYNKTFKLMIRISYVKESSNTY